MYNEDCSQINVVSGLDDKKLIGLELEKDASDSVTDSRPVNSTTRTVFLLEPFVRLFEVLIAEEPTTCGEWRRVR